MKLINIPVAETTQSKTNIKGRNGGDSFDDLVASIKEKGILVPLLAREIDGGFEIIAGNRRLIAAKKVGLKMIPVQLVVMNDIEAREAQIVENLQRADIHPLDEGELYRKLIEESDYDTANIAIKVGKSESYVKQRLFLTNLEQKPADRYRSGKILDGHAVLIAKLSADDQHQALKFAFSAWETATVKGLESWIKENIYSPLRHQPWLKTPEAMEAVGKCTECEPNRASLFGDVKEGACTNVKCWTRKMKAFISWRVKQDKLIRISDEYSEQAKGITSRSDYVEVGKKPCKSVQAAIIASGANISKEKNICMNKSCSVHKGMTSHFEMTPKEQKAKKATRKKEIATAKKKKADMETKIKTGLATVRWPLTEKKLDVLLAMAFDIASTNARRCIAKRRELEIKRIKRHWGIDIDYTGAIERSIKEMNAVEKLRLVFEFLGDSGYGYLQDKFGQLLK